MENTRKFKVGQKVIIARALGVRNGRGSNVFYYNGNTDEVVLGTRANVISFDGENTLVVQTPNRRWTVHPDELQRMQTVIQVLPGVDRLERHPVFEMADSMPIAVMDEKVLSVDPKTGETTEIASLDSLDEMYWSRNQSAVQGLQDTYVKQVWSELGLERKLGAIGMDVPTLIAAQVFPHLRAEGYGAKIAGMIGIDVATPTSKSATERKSNPGLENLTDETLNGLKGFREELDSETLHEIPEQLDQPRTKRQIKFDALLGTEVIPVYNGKHLISKAVGAATFMISQGKVEYLARENDEDYIPGEAPSLASVQENFQRLVSQEIRKGALDARFSRDQISKEISDRLGDLSPFAGRDNYDEGEFGFTKQGRSYYLWTRVPQFAIKSQFDGNFYLFPESKAGFSVDTNSQGELKKTSDLAMVQNNKHPLTECNDNFVRLCVGYNSLLPGSSGKEIAALLRQTKEIVTKGYFGKGIKLYNCRRLGRCTGEYCHQTNHYQNQIRSESELNRLGVPIFDASRDGQ